MTVRQTVHSIGECNPQNTTSSVKITFPPQITCLGLLPDDDAVWWEFDPEVDLPVVASADHFAEMREAYGDPDYRTVSDGTTTFPKQFTAYSERNDHPDADYTIEDTLGFFAPESRIVADFERFYVGTRDDFERLSEGTARVFWGATYRRGSLVPCDHERVREVCIAQPGGDLSCLPHSQIDEWARLTDLLD